MCGIDVTGGKVRVKKPLDFRVFLEFGILFYDVNHPVKYPKIKGLGTYPYGKLSGQNGYGGCCGDRIVEQANYYAENDGLC